ncbi:MAG: hypothetical protein LH609_02250, partial [Rudanella sp.]|nr:hypothetical protein [Rudanella sp.]
MERCSPEYTEFAGAVPTWTKSYTYLGSSQLSTITPNGTGGEYTEYNHPDRLGTRLITNQDSGGVSEQAHLPFGRPLDAESTITNNNKRFTSYDRSARTGLDYAINRTYDSKQGRFTQVDPIDMEAVDAMNPQTLNFYTYCGNDPVNHVDPDGLFWGAIGRFFKKLFTNKWFLIAISVALAVITVGAGLGLWSLNGVVIKSVSIMGYTGVAMTLSVPIVQITVLGWVTLGLAAAAAIPALTSFKGILKLITGFAAGSINSSIFPVSGGGTPDWNPDAGGNNSQQPGRRVRRSTRRTGRGSWVDGWRPVRIPPRYRGPSRAYPRDYPTKDTVNRSAYFRTEGEAMFEASRILGPFPQKIETGKTRSLNGRWQH